MQDAYERLPEVAARWAVARRALLAGAQGPARLREGLPFSVEASPWVPPAVKKALAVPPPPPGTPVQAAEREPSMARTLTSYHSAFEYFAEGDEEEDAIPSHTILKVESAARQSLEQLERVARWSRGLGLLPAPPVVVEPLTPDSRRPGPRQKRGLVRQALDLVCWIPGGKER